MSVIGVQHSTVCDASDLGMSIGWMFFRCTTEVKNLAKIMLNVALITHSREK